MQKIDGLPVWGNPMPEAVAQMNTAMTFGATYGALMADHHIGFSVPVGGVIAFDKAICVNGVGYDIACGNKAILTDANPAFVRANIAKIMDEIQDKISFGVGRKNKQVVDHPLFDDPLWNAIPLLKQWKSKSREQLGTVGSGNHYVDIFVDESDRVWVGVHFGSRGLGHAIATHFVKAGGGKDGVHADPVIVAEDSDLGEQYLKCMELAGSYAYAGRDWVCQRVAEILGGNILEEVHNHHNFAWKETHFGKEMWVVRKGATPAFSGQRGFVGGSMGDHSVILEGIESEESKQSLYSTVHGAGRVMGRMQAKGNRNRKGLVNPEQMRKWVRDFRVELRGSDVDEAPQCYKRIDDVLKAHCKTIKILHTLKPLGVCMAGKNEFDPYKD